ncbi:MULTISPECIES: ribosome maturation factor RimM [unclassified Paenibacillus]|uniref:Ribosome maturation factor RimM n=1 Tax=Paenibacillus provencensis TaxID=441151 RepID=A0ABW3PTE5_9BACL|nr:MULTISPECIES: ribosome maturation factor RimM [unclassified Paenibacillus]MCM3130351.1 ribosome maturation factor RimM [Paenibacillus sp. MER 78]SFS47580.1 16S rRNA processing protein RimM [Paenibacillus sp. 453mf]
MSQFFNVGKIVNTHGIHGELKVLPLTDFPEERFAKGSKLVIDTGEGHLPVTVESARLHKNMYVVRLNDFTNINEVEKYKGTMLKVSSEYQSELSEDEFYFHQIVGCEVVTDEGETLGTIKEILTPGANDVWVVKANNGKEILLPYIDEVILHVDVVNQKVTVHLMEGLV